MSRAIALGVAMLLALACCAAYGSLDVPRVAGPTLFAANGEAVEVFAVIMGQPTDVVLTWDAGGVTGQDIMEEIEPCVYAGAISGDAVKGPMTYRVKAYYAFGIVESQEYSLLAVPAIARVKAQSGTLARKVVISRPWGTGVGTFGFASEGEGASTIPASLAVNSAGISVLDTANNRVLTFDQAGKLCKKVDLPTDTASDLVADGANLVAVDQLNGKAFRIVGNTVAEEAISVKGLPFGTKFSIDPAGKALQARDAAQGAMVSLATGARKAAAVAVQVKGGALTLGVGDDVVAIDLGAQVIDAAEVVTDGKGVVWVLAGVADGNGVAYKLLSFNAKRKAAKAATIQTYIPGDYTRRMVGANNGVLLFEGDSEAGRVVSFQPAGGEF